MFESLVSDQSIEETLKETTSVIELTENISMEETVVPESHPVEVDDESLIDPVDELVEETVGGVNCKICKDAKQHVCRKCFKPVCNLVCSEQDPSSINEMH